MGPNFVYDQIQEEWEYDDHEEELFRRWHSPTLSVISIEARGSPLLPYRHIMDSPGNVYTLAAPRHPFNLYACCGCGRQA